MKLREHISWERSGDGPGFLFNRRLGEVFGLNASSAVLLEALMEGAEEEDLVQALIERCGAQELTARGDVAAFMLSLTEKDLGGA
jgi:hypothetical protein